VNAVKCLPQWRLPSCNLEFLMRLKAQSNKGICLTGSLRSCFRSRTREEAIQYLEQAFQQRDSQLVHLHTTQTLIPALDPRYWAIVKKMGMPPLQ